jgi:preprotein translocase subunit SecY
MINKYLLFIFAAVLNALPAAAQSDVEMADGLRSSGKIYVVVVSLLLILLGLLVYIFLLDRKISRLEKENKQGL